MMPNHEPLSPEQKERVLNELQAMFDGGHIRPTSGNEDAVTLKPKRKKGRN